ncbi:MAG: ATP-binding cassette domain-containing protein [Betaproteobacteria bacterium]|nr:ATP-binding cassette domain-containing protein [Betaproteobacteria bacterium]
MQVELSGLRAGYGGRVVLALDALSIADGEHTLVLGPSGCGKTTLLNILCGIDVPVSGSVTVSNVRLDTLSVSQRDHFRGRQIGLVMQRLHLIPALTVEGNLRLAQKLAGFKTDDTHIRGTLASLGIADKLTAQPRQLSQGEAQRVAIARAVINRPALILADEPTSALDDGSCDSAIDLLFSQAKSCGATLIVATHDQRIKPRFSRVLQLSKAAA